MSEPGGVSSETLGWIGGVLALLGGPPAIAKAVSWWTDRAERRRLSRADGNREWEAKLKSWDADLDQRERDLAAQLREGLAECERHCAETRAEMARVVRDNEELREDNRTFALIIGLSVPGLARSAPSSPELSVIDTLMRTRFGIDMEAPARSPADLAALLAKLDRPANHPA
jgi:hypothetical protein